MVTIPVQNQNGEQVLSLPWVRAIRDAQELEALTAALKADQDGVVQPSHLVESQGEIVGAIALGSVVLVDVWAHREKIKARQSLHLLNLIENMAADRGARTMCLPCNLRSPYRPYMEKFGYKYVGESGMFYKKLR